MSELEGTTSAVCKACSRPMKVRPEVITRDYLRVAFEECECGAEVFDSLGDQQFNIGVTGPRKAWGR